MLSNQIKSLPEDWLELLDPYLISEKGKNTVAQLDTFLDSQKGHFHPNEQKMLAPFHSVSVQQIKVVIVGHFPYPKAQHTTGLPFSNPRNFPMALSVQNIFKSIISDLGGKMPVHGNLEHLPKQGVFLLNRKFTTGYPYKTFPKGHTGVGWENFSAAVIYLLSKKIDNAVFLLWGVSAGEAQRWIEKRHLTLRSNHPSYSPKNGKNPFLNCKHFSATNNFLLSNNKAPCIDWLPNN